MSFDVVSDAARGEAVRQDDRAYVFHSWSVQGQISPLPIAGAKGCYIWDYEGKRYLDFSSQLVNTNLGHQHPKLVAAIVEQAQSLATIQPAYANETRGKLARLIIEHAPKGMAKVFFTNGGADANENAVRAARIYTGRRKVLSFYRSYHGATATAISLTGDPRRWANEPADSSVVHFFGPYLYRSAFNAKTEEEECARALAHLEQVIALEGPQTIAAVIMETVVGTNGILLPPKGYLSGVREILNRYGILLICDEVMVGFGRTGSLFAVEQFDVVPDILTFAKGVNSGYVPLGGMILSKAISDYFDTHYFPGGLTYSGHPLACAPGVATFEVFKEEKVLENVKRLEKEVLKPRLLEIQEKHPSVGEVRGIGLFYALEMVKDKTTRESLVPYVGDAQAMQPMTKTLMKMRELGVMVFTNGNRFHIAPPLIITQEVLEEGLAMIDEALYVADDFAK